MPIFTALFQFLYGAIKRPSFAICKIGFLLFQFLYGAIKSSGLSTLFGGGDLFQFLYGAIKSSQLIRTAFRATTFQFLYGAIKSAIYYFSVAIVICFNSSMVRLKDLKVFLNLLLCFVSIPLWCD